MLKKRGIVYFSNHIMLYVFFIGPVSLHLYYIHFEITDDPSNLIGSQQCDLFTNSARYFFLCSKSHLF